MTENEETPKIYVYETNVRFHQTEVNLPEGDVHTSVASVLTDAEGDSDVIYDDYKVNVAPVKGSWGALWVVGALFGAAIILTILATIWKHHQ